MKFDTDNDDDDNEEPEQEYYKRQSIFKHEIYAPLTSPGNWMFDVVTDLTRLKSIIVHPERERPSHSYFLVLVLPLSLRQ